MATGCDERLEGKDEGNLAKTPVSACGCGHDHGAHGHGDSVAHGDACGCGHDHGAHGHGGSVAHGDACGCGHDHGAHGHGGSVAHGDSCGCGHDHGAHGYGGSVAHGDACGCGHDHGAAKRPGIVLGRIIVAALMLITALFLGLEGQLRLFAFAAVYLIAGYDIVWSCVRNLLRGRLLDENFLMTIASLGAFLIGEYPEAAGVMIFYQAGEFLENLAAGKSRKRISDIINIRPEFANLRTDEGIRQVPPEAVRAGDLIAIKPGERIPLDCVVIEGETSLDTSALTGESMPRYAALGSELLSGSINISGLVIARVTKPYGESTVARILELVEHASARKAPMDRFITRFARVYTPAVVALAALIAIVPPLVMTGSFSSEWLYRGLVFLVVSCPCALVLSIPLSYFGGLGCASKHGILIKGGNFLEALTKANRAVFDKTGTLTLGKFALRTIDVMAGFTREQALEYAAAAEKFSASPVAGAVREAFGGAIGDDDVIDYHESAGCGVAATYRGSSVLVGNRRLMEENGVACADPHGDHTLVYLAIDGVHAATLGVADMVKPGAKASLDALRSVGIGRIAMLTGDNEAVARRIGRELGVDEIYAGLLPGDKVALLEGFIQGNDGKLIYVGDGINDAPVLMRADIGFAMGGIGSDAAIESADVVIMNDELDKVAESIEIARMTRRIVLENIIFAIGTKVAVMALSVVASLPMYVAIFADVGVALLTVLNSMRALAYRTRRDRLKAPEDVCRLEPAA